MYKYRVITRLSDGEFNADTFSVDVLASRDPEQQLLFVLGQFIKSHITLHFLSKDETMIDNSIFEIIMTDEALCLIVFCDLFSIRELTLCSDKDPEFSIELSEVLSSYGICRSALNNKNSKSGLVSSIDLAATIGADITLPAPLSLEEEETVVRSCLMEAQKLGTTTIRDPEYARIVLTRTLREITRLFDLAKSWTKIQFTANDYYWNIADRLPDCTDDNCSLKRFLPTETIVDHVNEVRYFIENQRIAHGLSKEDAFLPTI